MLKRFSFVLFFFTGLANATEVTQNRTLLGVKDEGIFLGRASTMNFVGAGVNCVIDGGTITCTISGGGSGSAIFDNLPSSGIIPGVFSLTTGTINVILVLGSGTVNNFTSTGTAKMQDVKFGSSTVIDNTGITTFGNWHVRAQAVSTTPLTVERTNTEGRLVNYRGSVYDYGVVGIKSSGIEYSSS